jgi:hypothetical protein
LSVIVGERKLREDVERYEKNLGQINGETRRESKAGEFE